MVNWLKVQFTERNEKNLKPSDVLCSQTHSSCYRNHDLVQEQMFRGIRVMCQGRERNAI